MNKDYIIVCYEKVWEVEEKVNEYISKGYVPVGMLITTPRENALGWHGSTTTQTLIKKEIVIDILRKAIEQSLDLIIKSFIKKSLEE